QSLRGRDQGPPARRRSAAGLRGLAGENGDADEEARQRLLVAPRPRIAVYVAHVQELVNRDYAERYPRLTQPTHRADYISAKWCRVVTEDARGGSRSVYCFICPQDGFTKALGHVRAGDTHKADLWKRSAKHARGSVFADDFGNCSTTHGIVYLR
ncbi:MAG TPA: hypothetical protein VHR66_10440, partial [Gemmataceae bacterium]|nr:hypothetical protein [Gemmataceae bacterium]